METMAELGAADKPMLTVFNKIDLVPDPHLARTLAAEWPNSVAISAKTGAFREEFMEALVRQVRDLLGEVRALLPYSESSLVQDCYDYGRVHKVEYREDGIYLEAELVTEMRVKVRKYQV